MTLESSSKDDELGQGADSPIGSLRHCANRTWLCSLIYAMVRTWWPPMFCACTIRSSIRVRIPTLNTYPLARIPIKTHCSIHVFIQHGIKTLRSTTFVLGPRRMGRSTTIRDYSNECVVSCFHLHRFRPTTARTAHLGMYSTPPATCRRRPETWRGPRKYRRHA